MATRAPETIAGIIWYRLPVATDRLNWSWKTLSAVKAGTLPQQSFEIFAEGSNPVDLSITNVGQSDEDVRGTVCVSWTGNELLAADALTGWNITQQRSCVLFRRTKGFRLPPGATRGIGSLLSYTNPGKPRLLFQNESKVTR